MKILLALLLLIPSWSWGETNIGILELKKFIFPDVTIQVIIMGVTLISFFFYWDKDNQVDDWLKTIANILYALVLVYVPLNLFAWLFFNYL